MMDLTNSYFRVGDLVESPIRYGVNQGVVTTVMPDGVIVEFTDPIYESALTREPMFRVFMDEGAVDYITVYPIAKTEFFKF